MKKHYSLLFSILFIIFVGIILYSFLIKDIVEGFSIDTNAVASSATSSIGYYDNLSRLPADNVWSSSTKKKLLDYFNSELLSKEPNATPMTEESTHYLNFVQNSQPFSTDSEVDYYIKNSEWQWDGYVTDYIENTFKPLLKTWFSNSSDEDLNNFIKTMKIMQPNRMVYQNVIMKMTVPQISLIEKLNFGGFNPMQGTNMQCVFLKEGEQTQPDGKTTIKIEKDGKYLQLNNAYTLDNNAWTTYIPGFTFKSDPCNVCQIEQYTDPKNTCLFTISTPEAFDKYMGSNSLTSSTSSVTSSTSSVTSGVSSSFGSSDKKDDNDKSKKDDKSSSWF